jgi:hypothetical protein
MRALYWNGRDALEWREDAEPVIVDPADALVRRDPMAAPASRLKG